MSKAVHLKTPISEEDIRILNIGDEVYLSGDAYCMLYADHYTLLMDKLRKGEETPMDLKGGVIYNTGAIWRSTQEEKYKLYALCATSSNKFNSLTPEFIALSGVRAIIGKGGMDEATLEAMERFGCVYLSIAGGCCAVYTPSSKITGEYLPKIPPTDNQRLRFALDEFGPLLVAMDAHGNSLFKECADYAKKCLPAMYAKLGIE